MNYSHNQLWVASNRGQSLVEVVVMISVAVTLVMGLIAGTTVSLRSAQTGRVRSQAVSYAQEGLEVVRAIRDKGWGNFISYSGLYCMGSDKTLSPSAGTCSVNIVGGEYTFSRSVRLSWQDPKMVVTSTVSYVEGAAQKDVQLVTYLTQWK